MRPLLVALCTLLPLAAQHVHPHPPSSHGHDQIQRSQLYFGTVDVPPGVAGQVRLVPGPNPTLNLSGLLKKGSLSVPTAAAYYIKQSRMEGRETTWKVLQPPASALTFDLVNEQDGQSTVRVTLDPVPSPAQGNYNVSGTTFTSPTFYWGGTVTLPADLPEGTYSGTTPTWTTIGPATGQPVQGFVITEDFCDLGVTYGISSESTTFQVSITIQRTRDALQVTPKNMLHFGSILPSRTNQGTVTVTPEATTRRTRTGDVTLVASGTPASSGTFTILGAKQSLVDFMMPTDATLTGPTGATMPVTNFTFAILNAATITADNNGSGAFRFGTGSDTARLVTFLVGATLTVAPGQTPGTYTGTYPLNFAYR